MTIESAINFEKGMLVKHDPDLHIFERKSAYLRNNLDIGEIKKVDYVGRFPTGMLTVKWKSRDYTIRMHCKYLRILR